MLWASDSAAGVVRVHAANPDTSAKPIASVQTRTAEKRITWFSELSGFSRFTRFSLRGVYKPGDANTDDIES